jgi:hypothetical protein
MRLRTAAFLAAPAALAGLAGCVKATPDNVLRGESAARS